MARKVFISSDMSVDESIGEISEASPISALMWPWMLTAFDDWGRSPATPRRLKSSIFQVIDMVTTEMIEEALGHYHKKGLIILYEVEGKPYMCIPEDKWYKYQTHMNRKNRRPGKDKMQSDFPSPQEPPWGLAGDSGAPRFPVPSPSPSFNTTTTHAREDEGETIEQIHLRVFGNIIFSPLMSDFIQKVKAKGYTDVFIKELLLEAGESSSGKPNMRYLESIFESWDRDGIYTRSEAQRRRDRQKPIRQATALNHAMQLQKENEGRNEQPMDGFFDAG